MSGLQRHWYRPSPLAWLLLPLAALFCLTSLLRRRLYRLGVLRVEQSAAPVVVIGNIVVGGAGKTPLLMALCRFLQAQGLKPGVVSRGYGGRVSGPHLLQPGDSADLVGDEPLMIYRRCEVPVVVGVDRAAAVRQLLTGNRCDIVLSDDGLQHYRMDRAYEIAVIDARRGFGNGFCLPAGPLREPVSRLRTVDTVVYNGRPSGSACAHADRDLYYTLETGVLYRLADSSEQITLADFARRDQTTRVHAFAGIGDPSRFFAVLREHGLQVVEHGFADHHRYTPADFSGCATDVIIMTEKDAVKCEGFDLANAWVLRVDACFSAALQQRLQRELPALLTAG